MRQEIVQAARQIIREKGIDGLSMRAIAKVVHTSPANLYEYFLNKEEIIISVYNEFLAGLLDTLQQIPEDLSGQGYLVALCMEYIDYVGKDPSQLQIASYPAQIEISLLSQDGHEDPSDADDSSVLRTSNMLDSTSANSLTTDYTANTEQIFELFLQAVEKCIDENLIATQSLSAIEITHVIWAFVHGLVTLSIQDVSIIDRNTMQTAIVNYIVGLSP